MFKYNEITTILLTGREVNTFKIPPSLMMALPFDSYTKHSCSCHHDKCQMSKISGDDLE